MHREKPEKTYRITGHLTHNAECRIVHDYRDKFAVTGVCEFFAVSRAAYYVWFKVMNKPDLER